MAESRVSTADVVLIGDSIVRHFEKYPNVLHRYFKHRKVIHFGLSSDRTQHVLWWIKFGCFVQRIHFWNCSFMLEQIMFKGTVL